jgi:hypothetical protein
MISMKPGRTGRRRRSGGTHDSASRRGSPGTPSLPIRSAALPTPLSLTEDFPASPPAVYALYTDAAFLQSRLVDCGALEPKVLGVDATADGVTTVTRQSIPASVLPAMVSSMMSGDPVTERTESWRPDGDGYRADFSVTIKGAPASIKGTMTLTPAAAGSTLTVEGQASVPIPLFGGKIEQTVVEQVGQLIRMESDYTRGRLGD